MYKNLRVDDPKTTVIEGLKIAKATGYEGIEVNMEEIAQLVQERSIDYVKSLFSDAGITIGGWLLPSAWKEDYKYVSPSWEDVKFTWRGGERQLQNLLKALPDFAKIGQELGCGRVYTWILTFSDEMDYDDNFRWHVERLHPVVDILRDFNCRLGLEWQAPKTLRKGRKYEFIKDMKGTLELCREIEAGRGSVGLLLDSWHWYLSNGTLEDIRKLKAQQVVYVHICDAPPGIPMDRQIDLVRSVPGETGVIDLIGFLKCLEEIGYDGPVTPSVPGSKTLEGLSLQEEAQVNCNALVKLWQAAGLEAK